MSALVIPALAVAYALADRFAGGGWPKLDARLPGRGAFWAALACGAIGWFVAGLLGACVALAWFIWRTPPWKLFGGSSAPETRRQVIGLALRHAIGVPGVALAAHFGHATVWLAAAFGVAFVVIATSLGIALGAAVRQHRDAGEGLGSENTWIELTRGATFGAAMGVLALIG